MPVTADDLLSDAGATGDNSRTMVGAPPGLVEPGNINLDTRPQVRNADGSVSTVRSITVTDDKGRGILIPTVSDDGRILNNQDAVDLYRRTGRHLGVFRDESSANGYAQSSHAQMGPRGDQTVTADDLLADAAAVDPGSTTTTPTTTGNLLDTAAAAPRRWLGPPLAAAGRLARQGGTQPVEGPGILSDLGTVAQTALLPEATGFGMTLEGAGRLAGMKPENAETLGNVGYGLTAAGQAIKGGIEGVQNWRTARAVRAGLPVGGQEIARAGATAELQAAPGTAAEAAGQALKGVVPGAAAEEARNVRTALYDPIAKYAADRGLSLAPGSPEATALADEIEAAQAKWGGQAPKQVQALLGKLKAGTDPVTYADLDAAVLPLQKIRGASTVRSAISDAMDAMTAGTPAGAARKAAGQLWKLYPAPAAKLAQKVQRAESPGAGIRLLINAPSGQYRTQIAARLFGGKPDEWDTVLTGIERLAQAKAVGPGLKVASDESPALTGLARYAQHRAIFHGVGAIAGGSLGAAEGAHRGHPLQDAIIGLAVGGALPFAGTALKFLLAGASGRPAAAALARTISAWSQSQDPETQGAAQDVAAALQGQP